MRKFIQNKKSSSFRGLSFTYTHTIDSRKKLTLESLVTSHRGRIKRFHTKSKSFQIIKIYARHISYSDGFILDRIIDGDTVFKLANKQVYSNFDENHTIGPLFGHKIIFQHKQERLFRNIARDRTLLWISKYKPNDSKEILGNVSTLEIFKKWLQSWDTKTLRHNSPKNIHFRMSTKYPIKRAALLHGPPGVGKTISVSIITKELGYEPIKINISDVTCKIDSDNTNEAQTKTINYIRELTTNTNFSFNTNNEKKINVLVLDELESLHTADRGILVNFTQIIHESKIPIICICNDKYDQKFKTLRKKCLELEFQRPQNKTIVKRMLKIATAEGLDINKVIIEEIVNSANGDVRFILGQMQIKTIGVQQKMNNQVVDANFAPDFKKTLKLTPYSCTQLLFSRLANTSSIDTLLELVFMESSLVPLLVHENYLNYSFEGYVNQLNRMNLITRAAEAISTGDLINTSMYDCENWGLYPFAILMGTVYPAAYLRSKRDICIQLTVENNKIRFSSWLTTKNIWRCNKKRLKDINNRFVVDEYLRVSDSTLRVDYLSLITIGLIKPSAQIPKIEKIYKMDEYGLVIKDLKHILDIKTQS
jgi:replication factor C subunit 1